MHGSQGLHGFKSKSHLYAHSECFCRFASCQPIFFVLCLTTKHKSAGIVCMGSTSLVHCIYPSDQATECPLSSVTRSMLCCYSITGIAKLFFFFYHYIVAGTQPKISLSVIGRILFNVLSFKCVFGEGSGAQLVFFIVCAL